METLDTIPSGIPLSVLREITGAIQRDGWTPALRRTAVVLPNIFRLSPQEFESKTALIYQRTDM